MAEQSRSGAVIGWDIGGAHLKAARIEAGRVARVVQVPCKLWTGLDQLDRAFAAILAEFGPAARHAVTMTGELTDLFASRSEGVAALVLRAGQHLGADVAIYAGRAGFVAADAGGVDPLDIASANWHATAAMLARRIGDALLIDMGSTTTDIIPVIAGRIAACGYTDAERLVTGELVYTGATRTALMAFPEPVPFLGRLVPPMPEYFATMADVHRIGGRLGLAADQHEAADNGPKTVAASRLRLSRMTGHEVTAASEAQWAALAGIFAERQLRRVHDGAALALSGCDLPAEAPVVACGVGRFVIAEVARRLGRRVVDLAELIPVSGDEPGLAARASDCAPAVAVGLLASE